MPIVHSDSQRVLSGGGVHDERIDVVELTRDEARRQLFVADASCALSRPASMLYALSWFLLQHWPNRRAATTSSQ